MITWALAWIIRHDRLSGPVGQLIFWGIVADVLIFFAFNAAIIAIFT